MWTKDSLRGKKRGKGVSKYEQDLQIRYSEMISKVDIIVDSSAIEIYKIEANR